MNRRLVKWLLLFGLWTLIGCAFASQLYLTHVQRGDPVTWRFALSKSLADWYVFALFAIPTSWLARRFPLEMGKWGVPLLVHLGASALFSIAWWIVRVLIEQREGPRGDGSMAAFSQVLVATFAVSMLVYWAIVSVTHALSYYSKYQEREVRAAELERRLTEARLQALQMQLNPHFLFNTLHAISSLVHKDAEAADRMISRLSDLLRYTLESTQAHEVPLQQELQILDRYLEIEQTRFGARLSVQKEIAPEALPVMVPNLILQPIVENAIKHGIEPHARPGVIRICASRGSGLILEVRDNGKGLRADSQRERVGISNTRARLEQLYPSAHQFEMANLPEGGLCVRMEIPWRTGTTGKADSKVAT
jgi:two-component system, LytTR family, sensor kinase